MEGQFTKTDYKNKIENNMKIIGIYLITSPTGKRYIGSSKDIEKRFKQYRRLSCKEQTKIYNSLNKYGIENHTFEVIYQCNFEDLYKWERFFGEQFNCIEDGLNCSLPAYGDKPLIVSEETKNKMSQSNKGKKLNEYHKKKISKSNKGKKFTDEHKNKLSESHKGKKFSDETRKKLSELNKGKKFSDESRKKMSDVKKGKTSPNKGKEHSEETKKKISELKKGKKFSDEHKKKLSESKKGKKLSEEHKKKISESLKKYKTLRSIESF